MPTPSVRNTNHDRSITGSRLGDLWLYRPYRPWISLLVGVTLYILQLDAFCHLMYISFWLWGLRSYSVTYLNFKVLYIGRESDVIVTCFVGAFVSCVELRVECGVMKWYRRLVSNGTCFSEPRASSLFMVKVHAFCCGLVHGSYVEKCGVLCVTG
jgi:hypothetical protein